MLKSPETPRSWFQRSKPAGDNLLSKLVFSFNLRRYVMVRPAACNKQGTVTYYQ
jgi:hypothetical protein